VVLQPQARSNKSADSGNLAAEISTGTLGMRVASRPIVQTVIVRYQVRPEKVEEHLRLVRQVFAELADKRPAGLRYTALRATDGLSFTHVAAMEGGNQLAALGAFQAFLQGIAARCDVPPAATEVEIVGSYGLP
jgi:hypothetical protein